MVRVQGVKGFSGLVLRVQDLSKLYAYIYIYSFDLFS